MKHNLPLEDFKIITYKEVTARKDHICICGKPIKKGEKYIRCFCKSYEVCTTFKLHNECLMALWYAVYGDYSGHEFYPVKTKLKLVRHLKRKLRKIGN